MKRVFRYLIDRPLVGFIIYLFVFTLGILGFFTLKQELRPSERNFLFTVETRYQNYPAPLVERVITKPLEESLSLIPGVAEIESRSEDGKSAIQITFHREIPVTRAELLLYEATDAFSLSVPSDCEKPQVFNYDPAGYPDMIFAVQGEEDSSTLRALIYKEVVGQIKRIPGIAKVDLFGGVQYETVIEIPETTLKGGPGVVSEIHESIGGSQFSVSARTSSTERGKPLYLENRIETIDEIAGTPVNRERRGGSTPVGTLAEVRRSPREPEAISRKNNTEILTIAIYVNTSSPLMETGRAVRKIVEERSGILSQRVKGFSIESTSDLSAEMGKSMRGLYVTLAIGVASMVIFSLLILSSFRLLVLTFLALPFSLAAIATALSLSGRTLNVFSIIGAALCGGMVIDASVLMIEYLMKGGGRSPFQIALRGARPIGISTLTSCIVCLPFFFTEIPGTLFLIDISITLFAGIGASLIYALFILPGWYASWVWKDRGGMALRQAYLNRVVGKLFIWQRRVSARLLAHRGLVILLTVSLFLAALLGLATSTFSEDPLIKEENIYLTYEFTPGTSMEKMGKMATLLTERMRMSSNIIKDVYSKTERYRTQFTVRPVVKRGEAAFLSLENLTKEDETKEEGYLHFDDRTLKSKGRKQIRFLVTGPDYDSIKKGVERGVKVAQKSDDLSGIVYHFREDFKEVELIPKRDSLHFSRLSLQEAAAGLFHVYSGFVTEKYIPTRKEGMEDIRIVVSADHAALKKSPTISELMLTEVRGELGSALATDLFEKREQFSQGVRFRHNKNPALAFTIEGKRGVPISQLALTAEAVSKEIEDGSIHAKFVTGEDGREGLALFVFLSFLSVIYLIYITAAGIYKSFSKPLWFLLCIVTTITPTVFVTVVLKKPFTINHLIAFAILAGLSVNSAAILFDGMEVKGWEERKKKHSHLRRSAELSRILQGSSTGILLSFLTTISGVLPALFGAHPVFRTVAGVLFVGMFSNIAVVFFLFPALLTRDKKGGGHLSGVSNE